MTKLNDSLIQAIDKIKNSDREMNVLNSKLLQTTNEKLEIA
jgi:hypothetical protein